MSDDDRMTSEAGEANDAEELAEQRTEWAKERTEEAEERTDWAQERTLLAEERTFSAWVRTGITAIAAGVGIAKLLASAAWPWITRAIGVIFVLAGMGAYLVAFWRYRQQYAPMKAERVDVIPLWALGLIILALLITAVLAVLLILEL